jgi:hypothetical protein
MNWPGHDEAPHFRIPLGRAFAPEMGDRHVDDLRSPEPPPHCHRLSVGCGHCGIGIPWPENQEFDHPDARKSRSIYGASGPRSCRHDAIARCRADFNRLASDPLKIKYIAIELCRFFQVSHADRKMA